MVVEWSGAGGSLLPPGRIDVTIDHLGGDRQRVVISAGRSAGSSGMPDAVSGVHVTFSGFTFRAFVVRLTVCTAGGRGASTDAGATTAGGS